MKKVYEEPIIQIKELGKENVMTTSGIGNTVDVPFADLLDNNR